MRAPSSGSRVKYTPYPDIVAIKNKRVIVLEVKTISYPRTIYVSKYQYNKLVDFIKRSGGEGYVAVKLLGTGEWRFHEPSELEEVNGKYRLRKEKMGLGKPISILF